MTQWCLAALLALGATPACAEVVLGSTTVLSTRGADNRHPAIAASVDGVRTFATWDGDVNGARRIIVRESVAGEWLPEGIVDDRPGSENSWPAIDVSDDGTPHVAWLTRENGRVFPRYATRIAGRWVHMTLSAPEGVGDCDFVTVKVDDEGRPWIAWQVGQGSIYEILCASPGENGTFLVESLTPDATSHNLFPEIFFDPDPVVAWYADRGEQTYLVGEQFDRSTGQWGPAILANLENLPTEPVPQLIARSSGPLAALWYERVITPAGEISQTDRVLMGEQTVAKRGAGVVIDKQPNANNRMVAGAAVGANIVAVWVSDQLNRETEIVLGYGPTAGEIGNTTVSDGDVRQATNPKVSAVGADAGVIWESNAAGGGDGRIYYRSAKLQP